MSISIGDYHFISMCMQNIPAYKNMLLGEDLGGAEKQKRALFVMLVIYKLS